MVDETKGVDWNKWKADNSDRMEREEIFPRFSRWSTALVDRSNIFLDGGHNFLALSNAVNGVKRSLKEIEELLERRRGVKF